MYERFCLLATALKLPPWEGPALTAFLRELKRRVEAKAVRLETLLPGISFATSRDAICRASVMLDWRRMEEALDRIESQQELEEQAWDLIDMVPACYEPDASDFPLAALPRVSVRTFADRLEGALRLDAPHAYQLTAELYGARDWPTLAGSRPFLPIAEPLYSYRRGVAPECAWLEPSEAAYRADEEFEAMAQLRQEIFQADLAQNEFVDQPGLLCAGAVGAALHLVNREYEIAEWKARSTLQAVEVDYPDDCRRPLALGSRTHLLYIRLRAALYASLAHAGKTEEAHLERARLTARGKEYRADYERLLRQWAPRDARPQHRTALHVVA
ncbi:hypothetical protein BJG93_00630 [Paraburkholderia sprentiae WSM5005]|uniref:Uncharacterized protein n=1 Tax=Paraburkholderia sprentiae WSM5005 TaxID=754502 RepID=A0A1I9YCN9_9BURK|nr:hypothetical protein [Paraburkholderia sprentiae]APA84072.1 hypothetical protein BJG93_00630 [Paraburkholderia sprentiae WSM5005]